jgi:hypothetical protein
MSGRGVNNPDLQWRCALYHSGQRTMTSTHGSSALGSKDLLNTVGSTDLVRSPPPNDETSELHISGGGSPYDREQDNRCGSASPYIAYVRATNSIPDVGSHVAGRYILLKGKMDPVLWYGLLVSEITGARVSEKDWDVLGSSPLCSTTAIVEI